MLPRDQIAEGSLSSVMVSALLRFSDLPNLQGFLFGIFFLIYIFILTGNGLITRIMKVDSVVQTPMYYFSCKFFLMEICYVSVTLPRILVNLWSQDRSSALLGCATQMCFFLVLGAAEVFLLAVMAYDHYTSFCNPLHYPPVMSHEMCIQLAVDAWLSRIPTQTGQRCQVFSLPFSGSNQINFCDIPPLIKLACGDTSLNEMCVYVVAVLFVMIPFLLLLGSYVKIISTILKLPSATGWSKAFSTYSSHFLVVILFLDSVTIIYIRPKSNHSAGNNKILSFFLHCCDLNV